MFPTNHSTSDSKTMTIAGEKIVNPTKTPVTTSRPKYLVAVFSVLVVSIVAVLVVTVASQARNSTRQEQYDTNAALPSEELRHPRFIGRPVGVTTETAQSIITEDAEAFMRHVTPSTTVGNETSAARRIIQLDIARVDKEPGASEVFSSERVI